LPALQYTGIVFGFAFGVWLFDDPVTPMALAGMVLIIGAGVGASFLRVQRGQGRPRPDSNLKAPPPCSTTP
jgi:drug/metabolite transporter (DMT)-like permease